MKMIELLSPAGTMEKMKTAFHFGADAVYFAGKKFGLRAYAGNFDEKEMVEAIEYAHLLNKKAYITLNIIAHDDDFAGMKEYVEFLVKAKADAVIVADIGVFAFVKRIAPSLEIHVSTQANIINSESAILMVNLGAKRLILARELSLEEIKKIRASVPSDVEIECFVHGAMCISYSGRCLLSNYLTGRDSNRGACAQPCRWEYTITEKSRQGDFFPIEQDEKGTYILNSKDLCMIAHLKDLVDAGVSSFKIEGRMKSEFYVGVVTNAYRKALDNILVNKFTDELIKDLQIELEKVSHRQFTTGFFYGANDKECLESSMPVQTTEFMAIVLEDKGNNKYLIEQRNRFACGEKLEIVSNGEAQGREFEVKPMQDEKGKEVLDAKNVQQKLVIECPYKMQKMDMLRKKII